MFDIIGKKRWFFLISALVTIPGLIFILLTPLTGGKEGLQFTIDYTGGTTWQIRFADPNVSADAVAGVFHANGLQAIVVKQQDNGFMDIKTEAIGLLSAPPSPTPAPTLNSSASPAASGSASAPVASASPAPSASAAPSGSASGSAGASAAPSASASPTPTPSPAPSAAASAEASASAPPPPPTGNTQLPTDGRGGEMVKALQAQFGPIAEQASLTTIGAVVSAD